MERRGKVLGRQDAVILSCHQISCHGKASVFIGGIGFFTNRRFSLEKTFDFHLKSLQLFFVFPKLSLFVLLLITEKGVNAVVVETNPGHSIHLSAFLLQFLCGKTEGTVNLLIQSITSGLLYFLHIIVLIPFQVGKA